MFILVSGNRFATFSAVIFSPIKPRKSRQQIRHGAYNFFRWYFYKKPGPPGDSAVAKIEDLELNHPVVGGRIVHWDNMERIWHHCFYRELKVAPEDRAVILGCSIKTPMDEK